MLPFDAMAIPVARLDLDEDAVEFKTLCGGEARVLPAAPRAQAPIGAVVKWKPVMSSPPLYAHVESVLAGDIADGNLPPETQLPPEEGLMERFKVSRTTVRKAIQNLAERGLVEVRTGKGTFVAQPRISRN